MSEVEVTLTPDGVLESSVQSIEPAWVDYNGHLNQVYYSLLFDRVVEPSFVFMGLGYNYIQKHNRSQMMAQSYTCFVRELFQTATVRVRIRILDVDEKRVHLFGEMMHARDGWLAATQEWMFLHLDMSVRRVSPWPADIRETLERLKGGVRLPPHKNMGRPIGIPRKG